MIEIRTNTHQLNNNNFQQQIVRIPLLRDLCKQIIFGNATPSMAVRIPRLVNKEGESLKVTSLLDKDTTQAYTLFSSITQLFKDIEIPRPIIGLLPSFFDDLGDIRIVLNLRKEIKDKFQVEVIFYLYKEDLETLLKFVRGTNEEVGLRYVNLDSGEDLTGLVHPDVVIYGPANQGDENIAPPNILAMYPELHKVWQSNSPAIFTLSECEAAGFGYSTEYNFSSLWNLLERALSQINQSINFCFGNPDSPKISANISNIRGYYRFLLSAMYDLEKRIESEKNSSEIDYLIAYFELLIPLALWLDKILKTSMPWPKEENENWKTLCEAKNQFHEKWRNNRNSIRFDAWNKEVEYRKTNALGSNLTPNEFLLKMMQKQRDPVLSSALAIHELKLGLDHIFSLGFFPLSEHLKTLCNRYDLTLATDRQALLEEAIVRGKSAFSDEDRNLIKDLPINGKHYFGYAHIEENIGKFLSMAYTQNQNRHVVLKMPPGGISEVEEILKIHQIPHNYRLYIPSEGKIVINHGNPKYGEIHIHLFKRIHQSLFDALMASADPTLALCTGDNTFFTRMGLGVDRMIYEVRSFKEGMLDALFLMANTLDAKERDAFYNWIFYSSESETALKAKYPNEYALALKHRFSTRFLILDDPNIASAFRKICKMIQGKSQDFQDKLTGFIKMKILAHRKPDMMKDAVAIVGDGSTLFPPNFARTKARVEELFS